MKSRGRLHMPQVSLSRHHEMPLVGLFNNVTFTGSESAKNEICIHDVLGHCTDKYGCFIDN